MIMVMSQPIFLRKRSAKKAVFMVLGVIAIAFSSVCAVYAYDVYVVNRFRTVNPGKVYKSGLMEIEKLEETISQYNLKSIIDLRDVQSEDSGRKDTEKSMRDESNLATQMGINYFNIPSGQIPSPQQVTRFLKIMDNPDNYPVLIHCYHGKGRAEVYSTIYRMEYQDYLNAVAIEKTRLLPSEFTSFAPNKSKGKFILSYSPRVEI